MASSSVARGSKLSSYGATSASSPTSPKKNFVLNRSQNNDDKFDGKHIHIMQCLAVYFRLFIILFVAIVETSTSRAKFTWLEIDRFHEIRGLVFCELSNGGRV